MTCLDGAMGSPKSTDKALRELLLSLPHQDLRFLCEMFQLLRRGSKEDLVDRLVDSEYSPHEIARPANEVLFGLLVEDFIPKMYWADNLARHGLPSSGSRHDLLWLQIESRLLDPRETLRALNPRQLGDVFYSRFNRVLTATAEFAISELLDSFGFETERAQPAVPERKRADGSSGFEYAAALSYASEQRSYVEQVAKILRDREIPVFYDAFEEVKMWGKDLALFLEELFRKKARYCVMFVSSDYARKRWPRWEGQAAIARLVEEKEEYVLPVRFDDTELPGLRPTIKYLDARRLSPQRLAVSIIEKLTPTS